jgi:hypothetical protein
MESMPTPPEQDPHNTESASESGAPKPHPEIGGKKFRVGSGDTYVPFRSRARRRRRKIIIIGTATALLLAVAAYGVTSLVSSPRTMATATPKCPMSAMHGANGTVQALPSTSQITVNVYNSTNRHGLAAATAVLLKQRGFAIGKVTNDPLKANLAQAAQVRGGSSGTAEMRMVAAEVPGTEYQSDARADHTVDLVLGSAFTTLASPAQVSAALASSVVSSRSTSSCAR